MYILKNPKWLKHNQFRYESFRDIPGVIYKEINDRLDRLQSSTPLVSIIIPAWNEEINILGCISSLSRMNTTIPFEIIVVNNNSTDNTQKTLDMLNVRSFLQKTAGCGPARQMGQENARGKYVLLADADCIYPSCWINEMLEVLKGKNVVCVYGRYSFIGEGDYSRWKLFLLEKLKDVIAEMRHFKRPYLNAYGMSMGYIKELGLKVGFVNHKIRGEDGRLCYDLMRYGKVLQVRSESARAWTNPRTIKLDGSFNKALFKRIKKELTRIVTLFSSHPPHDTKISNN